MEFWLVWIFSWIFVAITAWKIRKDSYPDNWLNYGLIFICIITVGGIICAKFFAMCTSGMMLSDMASAAATDMANISGFAMIGLGILEIILVLCLAFLFIVIPLMLTYVAGYGILGLYCIESKKMHIAFVAIFLVSVIGWTIPMHFYNLNIVKETVTESTEEDRQLLYFCNIPVQDVSGEVHGSSTIFGGSVSGSISTADNLPYWYVGNDGKGKYDSAAANVSSLDFIKDGETPYVRVIYYVQKEVTTNNNNGSSRSEEKAAWTEYVFYVPESVMQYTLG